MVTSHLRVSGEGSEVSDLAGYRNWLALILRQSRGGVRNGPVSCDGGCEPRGCFGEYLLNRKSLGCLLLPLMCAVCWGLPGSVGPPERAQRPNIVFILADDLGYGDLSCQNPASKIQTPRLDRLAREGVRFTDAHAPSALCTPSRYSILTGQYCWRSRLKYGVLNMWDEPLIAPERMTVANLLRDNGYRTACFGKWHLGLSWPFVGPIPVGFDLNVKPGDIDWTRRIGGGPIDHGFDYYFGVNLANQPPYAFIEDDRVVGVPTTQYSSVTGQQSHWSGPGVTNWDWSQVLPQITTNTVRWIESAAAGSQPFFLFATLVGPHQPVVPTAAFQGTSRAGEYGDYVQEIDWAVGQLLDALEATGAATNTLVIFSSDNGPDEFAYERLRQYGHASMGELRGIKSDIWEGGHRVPFLARWPGKIDGGTTNAQTICLIDFMRTVADVIGVQLPPQTAEDSASFLPVLLGNGAVALTNRAQVLESGLGQFGIRSNNWMYIDSSSGDGHDPELEPLWFRQTRRYISATPRPALLYDLSGDLGEHTNRLDQNLALAALLQAQLISQRARVLWSGGVSADWSATKNWIPAASPIGADVLYSNVVGLARLSQRVAGSVPINSIIVDPSVRADIQLSGPAGGSLTIANGIDMWSARANLRIATPILLSQSQVWNVSAGHELLLQGPLDIGGHELTICGHGNTLLAQTVSGSGRLVIRSSGTTFLGGLNSFAGGTELSGGGLLVAQDDSALGTGKLEIPNNSTLALGLGVTVTNTAVIQGAGAQEAGQACGAITVRDAGVGSYNGPITALGNTALRAEAVGSVLSIGGTLSGPANVTILPGAGRVVFTTSQRYTGTTWIEGQLALSGGPDGLPTTTDLVFANIAGAELDLRGNDQSVASISGGGGQGGSITLGRGTLTLTPFGTQDFLGGIAGIGNVVKSGPGVTILGGTNTYTGHTTVQSGTLMISGVLGNTAVTVNGGVLTGNGSIQGPVTIGQQGTLVLRPFQGALTLSNSLVLGSGSTTEIEMDPARPQSVVLQGPSSVIYGGRLIIDNVAPAGVLTNGQTFRLCSATVATGNFAEIQPAPGPGLVWRYDPTNGVLRVLACPLVQMRWGGPKTAAISWPGQGFHLQVLTNSAGLNASDQWCDYPAGASSPVLLPVDPAQRNVFFRLSGPGH